MKKICFLLAMILSITFFGACRPGTSGGEALDTNKTQLYVGTYDGGYGDAWLYAAKERFEEKYADVSFEKGKTGVQVYITKDINYRANSMLETFADSREEIMFSESLDYEEYQTRGLLLDITEAVTKPLNYDFIRDGQTMEDEESATIESKFNSEKIAPYYGEEGTYYAIPFWTANYAIMYDVDLFYDECFFFAADGYGDSEGFIRGPEDPLSPGPDGDPATTYDNGTPATFEEFFKMCNKMVRQNIVPFIWSGAIHEYLLCFMEALMMDYLGAAEGQVFYDFGGHLDHQVSGFDANGDPILYSEDLTPATTYKYLTKSAGRYYALEFLHDIIANKNYYDENRCFSTAYDHLAAQRYFILSKFESSMRTTAMLIDGSWWQNECDSTFTEMESRYGQAASKENRRFAIMAMPKVDETEIGKPTVHSVEGACYINANIAEWKIPLALEFLQFVHTRESLVEFSQITNTVRPYTYEMSEEELSEMTYYGRSVYELRKNADTVVSYSPSPDFRRTNIYLGKYWISEFTDGSTQGYPSRAFYADANLTARAYFEGFTAYYDTAMWTDMAGPFTN